MKKLISLLVICSVCGITAAFAANKANLNRAIASLDSQAKTNVDKKLVLKAVSQQTNLPVKTLQAQMSATHLSYGELLTADSIVEGSGKNLNAVLAMRKGKDWASLSKELRVDPDSIVSRLRSAEDTVRATQAATRAQNTQRAQGFKRGSSYGPQAGGPMGNTNNRGPR
jgi:hypothetical protein